MQAPSEEDLFKAPKQIQILCTSLFVLAINAHGAQGIHQFADWTSTTSASLPNDVTATISRRVTGDSSFITSIESTLGKSHYPATYFDPIPIDGSTDMLKDSLTDFDLVTQNDYLITFGTSVTNPRLHFVGLDRGRINVTGYPIRKEAGNSEFDVSGSFANASWDGSGSSDCNTSACGTITLLGNFSFITFTIDHHIKTKDGITTDGDGFHWTLSTADEAASVIIDASQVQNGATSSDLALDITFAISEPTTDFDASDVSISNGSLSNFSGSGKTYTATLTPIVAGAVTIDVAAGAFVDTDGTGNNAAPQFSWTYAPETIAPTVSIAASEVLSGETSDHPALTMSFLTSEPTTDFDVSDIKVTNAVLNGFSGGGTLYNAILTPIAQGAVTVDIDDGVFRDAASNGNIAAAQFTWIYDTSLPSPLNKESVTSSIDSWAKTSAQVAHRHIGIIDKRLEWLKRRTNTVKRSNQGIAITFKDQSLGQLVFSKNKRDVGLALYELLSRNSDSISQIPAQLFVIDEMVEQHLTQTSNDGENRDGASSTTIGGWSWWTMGTVEIGEDRISASDSDLDIKIEALTLGLDKPQSAGGTIGLSLTLATDSSEVRGTNNATDANSYSLALYKSEPLSQDITLGTKAGLSYLALDTTRIDGNETLKGQRLGYQIFLSAELREQIFNEFNFHNKWEWYVGGDWSLTKLDEFEEFGGDNSLLFKDQIIKQAQIRLGLDWSRAYTTSHRIIVPFAGIELSKNLSPASSATMRYLNETRVYTYKIDDDYDHKWSSQIGLDYYLDNIRIGVIYEREEQSDTGHMESFTLGAEGKF